MQFIKKNIQCRHDEESSSKVSPRPVWPGKKELPIVAFAPIPYSFHKYLDTGEQLELLDRIYQLVKECGCDSAIIGISGDRYDPQIPAAEQNGVKLILSANGMYGIEGQSYNILCKYIGVNNVVAWFSYDEPHPYQWGDVFYYQGKELTLNPDTFWNQLTLTYGITSYMDTTRISLFNLAAESNGSNAGSFGIPDTEYRNSTLSEKLASARAYLENLQILFNPWIWSYDFYPIRQHFTIKPVIKGKLYVEYEKFFGYLGLYQAFTQAHNSEFWTYGLCMAHEIYNDEGNLSCIFPEPTEGALRLEAFASLLYGAQGIVYFRYGFGVPPQKESTDDLPSNNTDDSAHIRHERSQKNIMAPISVKEESTGDIVKVSIVTSEIWNRLKTVNKEIKAFQDIFLGCTVKGHIQFSSSWPTSDPQSSSFFIHSINMFKGDTKDIEECIEMIACDGNGVLLSSFTNKTGTNGKTRHYVAVMNLSPFERKTVSFYLKKGLLHPVHHLVGPSSFSGDWNPAGEAASAKKVRHEVILKEGGLFAVYWDE